MAFTCAIAHIVWPLAVDRAKESVAEKLDPCRRSRTDSAREGGGEEEAKKKREESCRERPSRDASVRKLDDPSLELDLDICETNLTI